MSRSTKSSTKASKAKSSGVDIVNFAISALEAGKRLGIDTWAIMSPWYPPSTLTARRGIKNLEKSMRNRLPFAMKWFDECSGTSDERILELPELWPRDIAELFTAPISLKSARTKFHKSAWNQEKESPVYEEYPTSARGGFKHQQEDPTTSPVTGTKYQREYPTMAQGAGIPKREYPIAKGAGNKSKASAAKNESTHSCYFEGCNSTSRLEPLITTKGKASTKYWGCPQHLSSLQAEYNESLKEKRRDDELIERDRVQRLVETKATTELKFPAFSTLSAAALSETTAVELDNNKTKKESSDTNTKTPTKVVEPKTGDGFDHPMRCTGANVDKSRCKRHTATADMGPSVGRRCARHKTSAAYVPMPTLMSDDSEWSSSE